MGGGGSTSAKPGTPGFDAAPPSAENEGGGSIPPRSAVRASLEPVEGTPGGGGRTVASLPPGGGGKSGSGVGTPELSPADSIYSIAR